MWWKLLAGAVALGALWLGLTMFGNSRFHAGELTERSKWQTEVAKAKDATLAAFQAGLAQREGAETVYHETVRTMPGTVTRIIERATEYAQTDAGAAQCLSAERVQWIDQTRTALFPPATSRPADSGPAEMRTDPAPAESGRLDVVGAGGTQPPAG